MVAALAAANGICLFENPGEAMTNPAEACTDTRVHPVDGADTTISIELAPEQVRNFAPQADTLALGSRVFLTHLAGKPEVLQVEAAARIIEMGYVAVPHLAARNFKSERDYISHVEAHSRNGIDEVLFLGGNPALFPGRSANLPNCSPIRSCRIVRYEPPLSPATRKDIQTSARLGSRMRLSASLRFAHVGRSNLASFRSSLSTAR